MALPHQHHVTVLEQRLSEKGKVLLHLGETFTVFLGNKREYTVNAEVLVELFSCPCNNNYIITHAGIGVVGVTCEDVSRTG